MTVYAFFGQWDKIREKLKTYDLKTLRTGGVCISSIGVQKPVSLTEGQKSISAVTSAKKPSLHVIYQSGFPKTISGRVNSAVLAEVSCQSGYTLKALYVRDMLPKAIIPETGLETSQSIIFVSNKIALNEDETLNQEKNGLYLRQTRAFIKEAKLAGYLKPVDFTALELPTVRRNYAANTRTPTPTL